MEGSYVDRLRRAAAASIAAGLLLLGACQRAPEPAAGPQRLRVSLREFAFDPSEIEVRADAPVDLRLRNVGRIEHNWTLVAGDGREISYVLLEPGLRGRDRFTLASGTYDLLCTIEGHAEAGMRGTVTAG